MYFSDRITLRTPSYRQSDDGYQVATTWADREVWADRRSVVRSEFYEAGQIGVNLTDTFAVHTEDYAGEMFVRWREKDYRVERAFEKGGIVELSCTDKDVNHGQI